MISEEVQFGGSVVSAEMVQGEDVLKILPRHKRIKAFENLKKPETKKEAQSFCGMLSSLESWCPRVPLNIQLFRKECGSKEI